MKVNFSYFFHLEKGQTKEINSIVENILTAEPSNINNKNRVNIIHGRERTRRRKGENKEEEGREQGGGREITRRRKGENKEEEGREQGGGSNLLRKVINTNQRDGWKRKTNGIKEAMEITEEDMTGNKASTKMKIDKKNKILL